MAKLAKRARSAPLAICRSPIDTEEAWPEHAVSQSETAADDANPADLVGADLRAANLGGAALDHANFGGASLAEAELCGASLRFARLQGARLDAANLSFADLRHAQLDYADLSGAILCGALLDYADFSGANLLGADLSGAQLRYAKNLTQAQLDEGRVSESTILPLFLHRESWSGAPPVSRRRPIWIVGTAASAFAVLAGGMAVLSLVWPLLPFGDAIPAQANVAMKQTAEASQRFSLRAAVAGPGRYLQASEASDYIGSTPGRAVLLRPSVTAPAKSAITPDALPVAAGKSLPVGGAESSDLLHPLSSSGMVLALANIPSQPASNPAGPTELSDVSPPFVEAVTTRLAYVREPAIEELARRPARLEPVVARELLDAPAKPVATVFPGFDPLTLVVSLRDQKIDVYRGTDRVTSSKISSGKRGYETMAGVFSILEKRRHHHSNLYSNAPMPWMQRLTWSGTALHGGVVPGYPASHGCIRLPFSFAPKLFEMTDVGANVVVTGDRIAPQPIEHATLFQPAPPQSEIALAAAGQDVVLSADAAPEAALRILVTRRTERDQAIATQHLLASLGYLKPQNFTGRIGNETRAAIKAFQESNGLTKTGDFTDELMKKVHQSAGKAPPPEGHLFVRQGFRAVLDLPIAFRQPERSLGTHVFTLGFASTSAEPKWTAISLEGGDPKNVLDRIDIPRDVRRQISERLAPGSTLIVADTSVNSAILREGEDFLVLAKVSPEIAAQDPEQRPAQKTAKTKQTKANAVAKPRTPGTRKRAARQIHRGPDPYGGFRLFRRW